MSTEDKLVRLYGSWADLTTAEGVAIRAGDWSRVAELQEAKQKLQGEIVRERNEAEGGVGEFSPRLRGVVERLVDLERQNQGDLADVRWAAEGEIAESRMATRRLGQLRRAYGPGGGPRWQSYS